MRLMLLSLLSGCVAFAASPYPNIDTTQQKTGVSSPKDAAVVIGVEDYISLPDVPGAAADARLVRDTLVYTLGLNPSRVSLLTRVGGQGRVSRSGIQTAIMEKGAQVQAGGRLWVYFAGHGSAAEGSNERILLSDQTEADKASFADNSVSVSEIQAWGVVGGGQVVLVTDACFNGTGRDGNLQTGTRYALPVSEIQRAQLTQWHATSATQVAQPLPGTGHGAFTYFWVGALRGWADGQFGSVDGVVTAGEVEEYVSQALGAAQISGETPQFGGDGSWVVSKGRERGPDLSALGVAVVPEVLPDAGPDFAVLAAQAAEADRQAAALRVQVEAARREKLDAGKAALQAQASKNWASLGPALSTGGDSSIKLVQAFVTTYKGKSVTVEGVTEGVEIPEVAKAEAWLASKGGGSGSAGAGSGGSDWQSPTLGTMKWIPAGTFMMGSSDSESGRGSDETQHKVKLTHGFLMMEHEVTQGEWQAVMGSNPVGNCTFGPANKPCSLLGPGGNFPVINVSWEDIQVFIQKVSTCDHVQYRLPTEAEWEYAARGGQSSLYAGTQEVSELCQYANVANSSRKIAYASYGFDVSDRMLASCDDGYADLAPVKSLRANGYGLYDMSGNVWEWVSDWYGDYRTSGGTFKADSLEDPQGNASGSSRVYRGGSWVGDPQGARVANRGRSTPGSRFNSLGFRLIRTTP